MLLADMASLSSTIHILQLVKEAQQQHGLRHGDYQRYRQYCSRKLRRVRKSLKLSIGQDSRSVRKSTVDVAKIQDPKLALTFNYAVLFSLLAFHRYLSLFVFEADRNWAYAMQLKQEAAPDNRKRFHLMRKMRTAVRNCLNLEKICKEMGNLDAATKLEVGAYSSWMQGCLHFEARMWANAAECFTTAKTIYEELSSITDLSALVDVYDQRCREIAPPLRFCQFSIGDSSALADLVQMRLEISDQPENTILPDLNKLLTECRQKQANVAESEVMWCGRKLNFSRSVRTQSFYNSLLDLERQIREVPEVDSKLSLYEQVLSECRDVMQNVREEAKGELTTDRLKLLLMEANKGMYCSQVKCACVSEGKDHTEVWEQVNRVIQCLLIFCVFFFFKAIVENLHCFRKLGLADLKERVQLVRIPPDLQPVACKPLFFDLAFNCVRFPFISDEAIGQADRNKDNQKVGGLGNLVRGWIWGSKH
ncbi:hypothetical protein TTRE_0000806601 [Trichuris trichiura]|uniref:Signal recognition particle subunit SRP68 n=1 Tax=Trichuris trichiura TaxID=36087 RepID=A0A077ZHE4_TRITR|nr:hypothetical protein TTRE_0000806601 [Trichuris trichiura]